MTILEPMDSDMSPKNAIKLINNMSKHLDDIIKEGTSTGEFSDELVAKTLKGVKLKSDYETVSNKIKMEMASITFLMKSLEED